VKQSGIKVNLVNNLKKDLFDMNVKVTTIKNSLFRKAVDSLSIDLKVNNGSYLAFFVPGRTTECMKVIVKFLETVKAELKDKVNVDLDCGVVEGRVFDSEQLKSLTNLPSKRDSVSMIVGTIESSIGHVVRLIEYPLSSCLYVISERFKN